MKIGTLFLLLLYMDLYKVQLTPQTNSQNRTNVLVVAKVQRMPLNSQPRTYVLIVATQLVCSLEVLLHITKVQLTPHGHSQPRTYVLIVATQLVCSLCGVPSIIHVRHRILCKHNPCVDAYYGLNFCTKINTKICEKNRKKLLHIFESSYILIFAVT